MNFLKKIVIAAAMFMSIPNSFSATKDTLNVEVSLLSVWTTANGNVLVQTNPRHSMEGLTCSNNYWLVLAKGDIGFETTLTMLLASQAKGSKVHITASDNGGSDFCLLSRVTTLSQ